MSEIAFNVLSTPFYVPGQYAEFNNAMANTSAVTLPQKLLLVGQKLAAGSAAAGVPVRVTGADHVGALSGRGSMLHQMAKKVFAAGLLVPIFILPLTDKAGATKATQTVTAAGTATAAGTLALYVGDNRYPVSVTSGMTAAQLATAIVAAITANADRYVDASAAGAVVTLTARHGGVDVGKVDAALNRYSDESLPAGITITIAARTEGTGNPDLAAAITAMGDSWYPTICAPYTDAANLALLKNELLDRFGPIRQIDGYAFASAVDSVANLISLAGGNNAPWQSLLDSWDAMTPAYVVAAAVSAQDALESDPARPRQYLGLPQVLSKPDAGRRSIYERQQLLAGGVSTLRVDNDGTVRIERLTTTYRTNAYNVADNSYFDTESLHTLANIRYTWNARMAQRYGRHKLGDDGSIGPNVFTPSMGLAEAIAIYADTWMPQGWVEGGAKFEQFKRDVRSERDASDPNRLNVLLPPDLINQLRVIGAQIQFRQ